MLICSRFRTAQGATPLERTGIGFFFIAPARTASDANHFILTFENNRFASELFGQFDQNLKLLEERLGIDARARGNSVVITGDVPATNQARRTLDYLYDKLQKAAM